jgi:hypothetical protein
MSNAKHTKGPWLDWETMEWIVEPKNLLSRTEDARLIAAAPDLLEACKGRHFDLFALLNRLVNDGRLDETERDLVVDHVVFARAAIAKAEGRE